MASVEPNPKVMEWAINRSGLDRGALKKTWPKLDQWCDGTLKPTLKQIEKFAKKVHVNISTLFDENIPSLGLQIADFRMSERSHANPSPDLYDTINQMIFRQDWMHEYFQSEEYDKPELVALLTNENSINNKDIKDIAQAIRNCINISEDWSFSMNTYDQALKTLRDCIEREGVSVVIDGIVGDDTHRVLDVDEFRGFVLSDEFAPLIFVNGQDSKCAQIFTLAHELAHLAFAHTGVVSPKEDLQQTDIEEEQYDAIAAELLVPSDLYINKWSDRKNVFNQVKELSSLFKVSFMVCARKALDLSLINKKTFFNIYQQYQAEPKNDKLRKTAGGGNYYRNKEYRLGNVFSEAVYIAVQTQWLTYYEAFQLTGLNARTFDKYFERELA